MATTTATRQRYAFVIFQTFLLGYRGCPARRIQRSLALERRGFRLVDQRLAEEQLAAWKVHLHGKGPCFTCRDTGHPFLLSHDGNTPQLLHQAQGIEVGPLFGDLATHYPKEIARS